MVTHYLHKLRRTVLLVTTVFLLVLVFSFSIATLLSNNDFTPNGDYERTLQTTGTIKVQGLEIYGGDIKYDPTSGIVYVDWGELTLGAYRNSSFYIKSNSTVAVELELNVTNWTPPGIEDYLSISWDYNGTVLNPNQQVFVTVTLEVASSGEFIDFLIENEVTDFGFDINIYATGV